MEKSTGRVFDWQESELLVQESEIAEIYKSLEFISIVVINNVKTVQSHNLVVQVVFELSYGCILLIIHALSKDE